MITYNAPIDDMIFLFEKLRDNKYYNEIKKYNEINSNLARDILGQAVKKEKVIMMTLMTVLLLVVPLMMVKKPMMTPIPIKVKKAP